MEFVEQERSLLHGAGDEHPNLIPHRDEPEATLRLGLERTGAASGPAA